jgi:DNA-binding response OmpR family regulator
MDLVMPAMDGYETVRRIREQSADNQDKRCPIIAISANAFTEERNQSLEAGYDDFIAKPFKAELLLAMIEKHLGSSWGWLREDRDDADTKQNPGSPVPPPSASITTALLDFAKIGDVRGLKKQVDILLDEEKIAPETAAMFNKLIRNYQLSELTTLLQSYLV